MQKKNIIIIGAALLFTAIISIGIFIYINNTQKEDVKTETAVVVPDSKETIPDTRSNTEVYDSIIKHEDYLTDNGQPIFDVTNTVQVEPGWYVAKIYNTKDPTVGNAWVVLKDSGGANGLVVVAGPGTFFPPNTPIPESARKAMK